MSTPVRIQRRRTRGWTLAGAAHPLRGGVIVDRSSRYGNPCKVSLMQEMGYEDPHAAAAANYHPCKVSLMQEMGYEDPHAAAAANYRTWLAGNRSDAPTDEGDQQRERILAGLDRLRGKDLACPCPLDRACHADYLLRLANMPAPDLSAWVDQVRARVDRQRVRDGEKPMYANEEARS